MDQLKDQVKAKIKSSKSLSDYDQLVSDNKDLFESNSKVKYFEFEKQRFDEKVRQGRYAYVVKRSDFYNELFGSIDKLDSRMQKTQIESNQLIGAVKINAQRE